MIFQRSILREKIAVSAVILFTLLTITLVLFLVRGLKEAAGGSIAVDGVARLMLIATLRYFPLMVVVTAVISIIMTISRVYQDSEMAVWQTSGLSGLSLLRPVFMLVMPMFLFLLFMNAVLTPWANQKLAIYRTQSGLEELNLIKAGAFRASKNGEQVFYVDQVVGNDFPEFKNIFVIKKGVKETLLVTADSGTLENTFDNRPFFVLKNGHQYQDRFVEGDFQSMRFDQYGFSIDEFTGLKSTDLLEKPVVMQSIKELIYNSSSNAKAELYRRFSDAFMIIPMALLALVWGYVRPRGSSKILSVMSGLVSFMIYLNFIKYGESKIYDAKWSFNFTLMLVHGLVMGIAILALWYRQNSWRIHFPRLFSRR